MGAVVVINSAQIVRQVVAALPGIKDPELRFDRSGLAGWFVCTLDGRARSCSWWRQVSAWAPALDDDEIAGHIINELRS